MKKSFRAVHRGDNSGLRVQEVTRFLREEMGLDVHEAELCAKVRG